MCIRDSAERVLALGNRLHRPVFQLGVHLDDAVDRVEGRVDRALAARHMLLFLPVVPYEPHDRRRGDDGARVDDEALQPVGLLHVGDRRVADERLDVAVGDLLLAVGHLLKTLERLGDVLVGHPVAQFGDPVGERVLARVLAEHHLVLVEAHVVGRCV